MPTGTIRFINTQFLNYPSTTWPHFAFATRVCWLGKPGHCGSLEDLAKCPIMQQMKTDGTNCYITDHVDQTYEVFVPAGSASNFPLLNLCINCKYKGR